MRIPLVLALLALAAAPVAPAQTVVEGTVQDGDGAPLPYATVLVVGTSSGVATDGEGRFRFTTQAEGRQSVEARYVGLAPARARVTLAGDTVRLALRLHEALLDLDRAVVTADALAGTSEAGTGLTALDVVTTPGASADLLQAVQTLAGLTQVDEGAGLFVRGGDVSETVVLLDGVPLLQPYAFETPLGGTFGTVSPFLVRGTAFSTGAFSARYGGALSAVLALDSQDEPARSAQTVSLSLAAASLGADVPVGRGGLRLTANQTFTDALFWVNGNGGDFARAPRSTNASAVAAWPDVAGGRLKVLAMGSRDDVSVRLDEPTFSGVLTSSAGGGLGLVQWRGARGPWQVEAVASVARHGSEQAAGSFRLRPSDGALSARVEGQRAVGERVRLSVGAEGQQLASRFEGAYSPDGVLDPDAAVVAFDDRQRAVRGGAWTEAEAQLGRRVVAWAGLRASGAEDLGAVALDPRGGVQVALSGATRLRLAGGLYSQAPDVETVATAEGNLGVSRAAHLVGGVLHEQGEWTLRAEAYAKRYRGLVVERDGAVWTDRGEGRARGLDLFVRRSESARVHGWAAYSLLSSERTQARRRGEAVVLDDGPAPFDIRHALNVVGKSRLWRTLALGMRLRVSSGRPVTPVERGVEADGFVLPVEGPVGGARLPAYVRLDANVSYAVPLGQAGSLVLFGAVSNLLDRANVVGIDYAPDYDQSEPDVTAYRRSVYVGASLLLQ
jgi:hypothetical protein